MAFQPPKKLSLARVPTPIQPLKRFGKEFGAANLFVKRDDLTALGMSGNKVRKLEYLLGEAVKKKATTVITCGGVQSNHARATAVACTQMGLKCLLVLRGKKFEISEGNLFLDKLLKARIKFVSHEEFKKVDAIMAREAKSLERKGEKPYIIPLGGSNDLGVLGYIEAMKEVKTQQKQLGVQFDYYVTAVGSGGTLGGMILGKKLAKLGGEPIGFNVSNTAVTFEKSIYSMLQSAIKRWKMKPLKVEPKEIRVIDGYVGPGYAIPYESNLQMIKRIARLEGLFLDPVYTSKAFLGMIREIEKGTLKKKANYLFIHTGGIFGLLAQREHFDFL